MNTSEATLLAFDYGHKRIGIAIGNTITYCARALITVENRNREYRFSAVKKLIDVWQPMWLVVGLPIYPDGTSHNLTQQAKNFGNQLNGRFNLPVTLVDERYSSVEAKATGARAHILDAVAACIILQQYFDEDLLKSHNGCGYYID
ncbi:Holliday junction resolvase RuvX [Candidatus Vallotia lariciata]|uniref:Holliday junction resolvase RuvX n=1 Tax=Candidatus Vallotia laricis TaxID=2018052 RepID=UPI001D017BE3|nr:Holliday junction resolvase RuvX [Candidatus Vallotia lariciata]UDG83251.1 Putative pre-16S rRNA nuclease [Candidatus Vallotia lariciata]